MFFYEEPGFDPDVLQQKVELAHAQGRMAYREWSWPMLGPYNGYSGEQRVRAWQMQWAAVTVGWLVRPDQCSVCLGHVGARAIEWHNEDYARVFTCKPICKACHRMLHKRFSQPGPWYERALVYNRPGAWFANLPRQERGNAKVAVMTDNAASGSSAIQAVIERLRGPIQRRLPPGVQPVAKDDQ